MRIKLAASNFARWFIGVLGRECPILAFWGTLLPQNPKIGRIGHPTGSTKFRVGRASIIASFFRVSVNIVRRVDIGSACVDIRPSTKTDVLVPLFIVRAVY